MKHRVQGVALVMVLIIVALITIISTQLVTERNLQARRTNNILLSDNAWEFAIGAEILAKIVLIKSLKDKETVNLSQPWATDGIIFPIDGGNISAKITDLRSCFNLNGILATEGSSKSENEDDQNSDQNNKPLAGEKVFRELLHSLKLDDINPIALASTLRDWVDKDQQPAGIDGKEDYEYSGYAQPYRTADSLVGARSELVTISGFSTEVLERLLPYVCFIPSDTTLVLNANTIALDQPELLSSFYDNLSIADAKSLLNSRPESGFEEEDFNTQLPADAKLHKGTFINFSSSYFAVSTEVQLGRARVNLKSLLHYQSDKDDVVVLAHLGKDD